jgi:predicted adenylyl cyclase CyaB
MPANIEIKARVRDFAELRSRAERLSGGPGAEIRQDDTFFHTPHGRLKLRVLAPDRGQLIYYERADQGGPKRSDYHLSETTDPESLKQTLALAYGVRGTVRKVRYLYLVGQTRIHLDDVVGLGQFMELEVVLGDDQSDAEGQAVAEGLMEKLGILPSDLIEGAYVDILQPAK